MKDITSRKDIDFLMRTFYHEALSDSSIGVFFTEIAKIDLEDHLPQIVDFWEHQILRKSGYTKNVLQIHHNLSLQKKIEKIHFDTWLSLFNKAVDSNFKGENANLIKTRALSITIVMQSKIR